MRVAVYAGSFDPLTCGHVWMVNQGLVMFDKLIVAIGTNPSKKYTFTHSQRHEMLEKALPVGHNLEIAEFHNQFLVDYAKSVGAQFILRGIRSTADYEYERVMRNINSDMEPSITTVFLMPPRDIAEVSSSMIKGLIGPNGWEEQTRRYVPENVFKILQQHALPNLKKLGKN